MGEIADDMIDGACCEQCGESFDDEAGHPRLCEACKEENRKKVNKDLFKHSRL